MFFSTQICYDIAYMCPELIKLGEFPIRSFGVLIAIGFLVAIFIAKARARRYGMNPEKVWDLSFWLMLFGVLGARLAFILVHFSYFQKNPRDLLALQFEGLTSFGAIIAGWLTAMVYCKINKLKMLSVMDIFSVPVLIAHAFGRVGCFLNGCCYGAEAPHLPWAVHLHGLGKVHPVQLYDSILTLIGVAFIVRLEKRNLAPGQSTSLMFIVYSISRFIQEFWRNDDSSNATYRYFLPISDAQVFSLLIIAVATIFYIRFGKKGAIKPTDIPGLAS